MQQLRHGANVPGHFIYQLNGLIQRIFGGRRLAFSIFRNSFEIQFSRHQFLPG